MKRFGRRIAVDGCDNVGAEGVADLRLIFQRVGIGLADQLAGNIGMVEPLGDAMHHRALQCVVMQDRRIDEGRELGLAPHDLFGLLAHPRPDRIEPCRADWRACSVAGP